jgi:hypothetical protein
VGGAGEGRADLVVGGVVEDGRDVRVRADDPDLVRPGAEGVGDAGLVETEHPHRPGHGGGRVPGCRGVGPAAGEQQEPVPRDLPEPPRGS